MEWNDPFIPSILKRVATHLDRHSLLSCIRVCKFWHIFLEQLIWHEFYLLRDQQEQSAESISPVSQHDQSELQRQRYPSTTLIQRNARHIRSIRYYGEHALLLQLLPGCTRLLYLEVTQYNEAVKQLLRQNLSSLHTFICKADPLLRGTQPVILDKVWHLLKDMPNLRILEMKSAIVSDYEKRMFGAVCQKLTRLSLVDSKLIEPPKSETQDFDSLKTLILDRSYIPKEKQLQLFQLCPALEHLCWKSRTDSLPILNFLSFLNSGRFQCLKSLDISNSSKVTDHDFAKIIALLPCLINLYAAKTSFGCEGTKAVINQRRHQIEVLDFRDCSSITMVEAQAFLTTCAHLTKFVAPSVSAIDMAQQRWICLGLRELDVSIAEVDRLPAPVIPRHQGFYTQLASLTKLKVLRLGDLGSVPAYSISTHRKYMLDLKLDSGLGLLSTLSQLYELDITNMHAVMEFEELRWVLQNWRRLKRVVGSVHPNPAQRELSNEFLRELLPGLRTFASREELNTHLYSGHV
ncbi:hypothetical protein BGZ46_006059 [Entomortierella lignicola]|nr:hypothetical protein BGZ46_006059 [Entomortierella lignicola]